MIITIAHLWFQVRARMEAMNRRDAEAMIAAEGGRVDVSTVARKMEELQVCVCVRRACMHAVVFCMCEFVFVVSLYESNEF